LRRCVERSREIPEFQIMADAEQEVVGRFGTAFRPQNLDYLSAGTVTDFLREKVNHHWYGLERNSSRMTADMPALRRGMAVLLDDSAPLTERWDAAPPRMHGVGKAIASAMLLVVYPAQCGGWNSVSGEKMAWLGLIPEPWQRRSNGSTYARINMILLDLADSLGISSWELDGVRHLIALDHDPRRRRMSWLVGIESLISPTLNRHLAQSGALKVRSASLRPPIFAVAHFVTAGCSNIRNTKGSMSWCCIATGFGQRLANRNSSRGSSGFDCSKCHRSGPAVRCEALHKR
jgi:hypothetical protein